MSAPYCGEVATVHRGLKAYPEVAGTETAPRASRGRMFPLAMVGDADFAFAVGISANCERG
jgi:hypothetical protein